MIRPAVRNNSARFIQELFHSEGIKKVESLDEIDLCVSFYILLSFLFPAFVPISYLGGHGGPCP